MSYQKHLDRLRNAWKNDAPAKGGPSLPDGKYQFQIKSAVLAPSTASFNKGNLQVEYTLVVMTGEYKGKSIKRRVDIMQEAKDKFPSGISRFKGDLENLGLELPTDLTEKTITAILKQLVGIICNGQVVVNKKGFANVYINSAINAASEESDDEDEVDEDEEEESEDEDDESEDDEEEDEDEEEEEKPQAKPQGKKPVAAGKKPAAKKDAEADMDEDWEDE